MLIINYIAEELASSIFMWLILFFVLRGSLKLPKVSFVKHICCIAIIAIVCGLLRNYISIGKQYQILIFSGLVPFLVSFGVLLIVANGVENKFLREKNNKIKLIAGCFLLGLLLIVFSGNKDSDSSGSYSQQKSDSGSILPSTNLFGGKAIYTVFNCSNKTAITEAQCGEKVPTLKAEFVVDKEKNAVFIKMTSLTSDKKGLFKLDNCEILNDKNWKCGGNDKGTGGNIDIQATYAMVDGSLSYTSGFMTFDRANGTKGTLTLPAPKYVKD